MRTNGGKDLTKLIVAFDNFAKAAKNSAIYLQSLSDACDSRYKYVGQLLCIGKSEEFGLVMEGHCIFCEV
jgi:hypothetical protein